MQELVERLQAGDETAFEEFVTLFERKIYNLALRQLGNPQDAQDVTQEVFLRVYRNIHRFRKESQLSTWVYQITSNACVDTLRKRSRRAEVYPAPVAEDEPPPEPPDLTWAPETVYEQTALRERIQAGLSALSDEHRRILLLRELSGLSYTEIAQVLSLSEGTVKSRLFRARDRLSGILGGNGNSYDA